MDIVEEIILDLMCLCFPLTMYLIFLTYCKNQDIRKKEVLLEIALYSSVYLLIKFSSGKVLIYPMILLNIPLLISYLKAKDRVSIILTSILVLYYYFNKDVNLPFYYLLLEYFIYFIISIYLKYKKYSSIYIITMFVVIKSFVMSLEMFLIFNPTNNIFNNYLLIFSIMTIFTLLTNLILFLLNKGEEIIDLNNIVHELEKEKKLRESLFKITHEIKNPIAVCKGYLDMIDYENKDKIKKYISIIKDEINRTLILMDDFLTYTKIKIDTDITDLYLLLEETVDIVKPLFRKSHIKLNLNIDEYDEVYLELDYNRVKQVLVNLLKNCIEAKDNEKNDNYVSIDVLKQSDKIILNIKDNGIGMDSDTLNRIDEMFYTTKEKGTGLGVALSKEIINQHGGSIKYSSVKKKYTIVTIELPYNEKELG